jgi:hypothetical protein
VDLQIHIFLTSALVAGELLTSGPGRFIPEERAPSTHWIVGPRAGMEDVQKRKFLTLPGLEIGPPSVAIPTMLSRIKIVPMLN